MNLEKNEYYLALETMLNIPDTLDQYLLDVATLDFESHLKANYLLWRCSLDRSQRCLIEYDSLSLSDYDEEKSPYLKFPRKFVTDTTRERIRKAQLDRSPETQSKMDSSRRGQTRSEETRKRMSEKAKGRPAYNKGQSPSAITREKLRAANLGKKQSEETKAKRRAKMKELRWFNNGVSNIRSKTCPEGYTEGRIGFKVSPEGKLNSSRKGTHWFTNSACNVMSKECPEGFWPGKTKLSK